MLSRYCCYYKTIFDTTLIWRLIISVLYKNDDNFETLKQYDKKRVRSYYLSISVILKIPEN